jgi:hypothetical protein
VSKRDFSAPASVSPSPEDAAAAVDSRATDEALWAAVAAQAQVWGDLKLVREFAAELPRNARQATTGLPGLLQELSAMGADTWVEARPLLLGYMLPGLLQMAQGGSPAAGRAGSSALHMDGAGSPGRGRTSAPDRVAAVAAAGLPEPARAAVSTRNPMDHPRGFQSGPVAA